MVTPLHVQIYDGNSDGHTRVTTAETFVCRGGSSDGHEATVSAVMHVREQLQRHGKDFDTATAPEIVDHFMNEFDK